MMVSGADPFVLFDKKSGLYYCYVTDERKEKDWAFSVYSSPDLRVFSYMGEALSLKENNWAKDWFWAPEVYHNEETGLYFLFYSARLKDEYLEEYFADPHYEEGCKIGVAVSSSPNGPFRNISAKPLSFYPYDPLDKDITPFLEDPMALSISKEGVQKAPFGVYLSSIDVSLYFEKDKIDLFFSRCCYRNIVYDAPRKRYVEESNIAAVEISRSFFDDPEGKKMPEILPCFRHEEDGRRKDRFLKILSYDFAPQEWENGDIDDYLLSGGKKKNRRWEEGPSVFELPLTGEKRFALTYSCNNFENARYGVGIAFASSPLGPFHKYEKNPILHSSPSLPVCSTGHGSPIVYQKELYYLFHGRKDEKSSRCLYRAKLSFQKGGEPILGPIEECLLNEK